MVRIVKSPVLCALALFVWAAPAAAQDYPAAGPYGGGVAAVAPEQQGPVVGNMGLVPRAGGGPKLYTEGKEIPKSLDGVMPPPVEMDNGHSLSPPLPGGIPQGATVLFHRGDCPSEWSIVTGEKVPVGYIFCEKM